LATMILRGDVPRSKRGTIMARKGESAVYRVTEVIGTSSDSWEDAARNAVKTAGGTLRDLRIAEVTKLDVRIGEDGKVAQFRARLALSFKYDG
jgi:dodecin